MNELEKRRVKFAKNYVPLKFNIIDIQEAKANDFIKVESDKNKFIKKVSETKNNNEFLTFLYRGMIWQKSSQKIMIRRTYFLSQRTMI